MTDARGVLQSPSSLKYSTLEFVGHDATAGAPERDNAIVAPEYARHFDALQVVPDSGPEIFYSNLLPEAVSIDSESTNDGTPHKEEVVSPKRSRRTVFALIGVTVIFLGLAIGIGLGYGLQKRSTRGPLAKSLSNTTTSTATPR